VDAFLAMDSRSGNDVRKQNQFIDKLFDLPA